jgi:hypothetical protein
MGQAMDFSPGDDAPASEALPQLTIDPPLALTRPLTIKARDYWLALRNKNEMPAPADITPRGMREFLANVALFDVMPEAAEPDFMIRVAGTKLEELVGHVKGLSVRKSFKQEISARWLKILGCVMCKQEPVRVSSRVAFNRMNWLRSELFAAPLGLDGKIETIFVAVDIWPAEQPPAAQSG